MSRRVRGSVIHCLWVRSITGQARDEYNGCQSDDPHTYLGVHAPPILAQNVAASAALGAQSLPPG